MKKEELKEFLDDKAEHYNNIAFIEHDPISIPHLFTRKEDIEISGFLAATIAWGNRKAIIRSAHQMMALLDNSPFDFVMDSNIKDLKRMNGFVHRTFNSEDLIYFLQALKHIYRNRGGLENIFNEYKTEISLQPAIHRLNTIFFELPHNHRTERHISDPCKGSAAKKINMFLRWMVRKDNNGVDFGIWKTISPSILSCPLDVHSGNVARKLGLITRKQNDFKAVSELDIVLRNLDKDDPVRYDFALFGLGVSEGF
ncbi:MAG: TIGR02757 family protein [Bacteroidetes bacterium RBG_13_42_15]|nr:MAG: TIGR02757 family protein [Bacteroidetes bacterium RBG_13_42_15]